MSKIYKSHPITILKFKDLRLKPVKIRKFIPFPWKIKNIKQIKIGYKGIIKKFYFNGKLLLSKRNYFLVKKSIISPGENEIFIEGWPRSIWWEIEFETSLSHLIDYSFDHFEIKNKGVLDIAVEALLNFVVKNGPYQGDMFSFFDPQEFVFRCPRWRWDTGICLEALAKFYKFKKVNENSKLLLAIKTIVERLISIQIFNQKCKGGFPEIVDPHMCQPDDYCLPEWVVPFNAAFIGVGLLSVTDILSDKKEILINSCLQAHNLMVKNGISEQGFLKGYYHLKNDQWLYHGQINDSGIFPHFSAKLVEKGQNVTNPAILRYVHAILNYMTPEGYIVRAWYRKDLDLWPAGQPLFSEWRDDPGRIPTRIFSRGQAWCLFGLASAWKLFKDKKLAIAIKRLVDFLIKSQDESGAWCYDLGNKRLGFDVKGSAVIANALIEALPAYQESKGDVSRLKEACLKAWEFLMNNQKKFLQGPLPGALCEENEEGAIIYFRNRPMYVAYGTAMFILLGLKIKDF